MLDVDAEPSRRLGGRERPAAARPAVNELAQRRLGVRRLEEGVGQTRWRHDAEPVAVATGVLGRDQALLAGDVNANGAPRLEQRLRERYIIFLKSQISPTQKNKVQVICITRLSAQLSLDIRNGVRVEQVAQLLLAQELAQKVAVERQRLRPSLRRGCVVLEHVRGDVVEEQ